MSWSWTRRTAGLGGLAALAGAAVNARAAADPLSGETLYADVKTYADFGEHRTGTRGEARTTDWLETALRGAGYRTERQGFDFPVFEVGRCEVEVVGRRLQAFPVWSPTATTREGLKGRLTLKGGPGGIAVLSLPPGTGAALGVSDAYRTPIQGALAAGAAGVIAITENPVGELVALNAPPDAPPWPAPVLSVAGRDGPALLQAAGSGERATLRLEGRGATRRVDNLIARRLGPGKAVVVTTPKSGWFTCAGERGSGLAVWLGLARWLATAGERNLVLNAATAHEFDGYGGHRFVAERAPSPSETALWLHIGANVACYDVGLAAGQIVRRASPQPGRRLACSERLLPAARAAFAGQPSYAEPMDIDLQPAPGEIAEYQRRGYQPLIGIVGAHPLHHTRRDQPDITAPALLEPVGRGLAAMLRDA